MDFRDSNNNIFDFNSCNILFDSADEQDPVPGLQ